MSAVYFVLANNPFSQNWTDTGLISVDDNWDNVPSIVGFRGDELTLTTAIDPQTVLAEGTAVIDAIANQTTPNTVNTGGVGEFEIANPVVALQGSGTADAPFLLLYLNTSGVQNVNVSYLLRDIDGSVDNAIQSVALQYRVGTTGNFINIPAGFVADASSGPSLDTLTTTVSAVLPTEANNQAQVQVRIITANALGNDEWIGIDDINVTSAPIAAPPVIPPTPPVVPPVIPPTPPVIPTPSVGLDRTISNVSLVGQANFPTGFIPSGTAGTVNGAPAQVGGLSGVTYDAANNRYYAISDDRSQLAPARFYTFTIDPATSAVTFTNVITLKDTAGNTFALNTIDTEGIALTSNGTVFISSEGEVRPDLGASRVTAPFIREFNLTTGLEVRSLPVPAKFLTTLQDTNNNGVVDTGDTPTAGFRNNLAFESLTISPNQSTLFTATENTLIQDGAATSTTAGSRSRILQYNLTTGQPEKEFLYITDAAVVPNPTTGFADNGLVDLLAIDDRGTLLALERSFSIGVGNTIKLYEVTLSGATDITSTNSLTALTTEQFNAIQPARKRLVLNLNDLNLPNTSGFTPTGLDNVEGLAFGPTLADGRQSVVLVSDNNFSATQVTQVITLGAIVQPSIQITEYLYTGNNGEFVEITNIGLAPIDFTGWSFDDNTRTAGSFSLSAFGIVQPNESVILTETEAGAFRSVWNLAPTVRVIGGSNQGIGRADELNIYDASGQLVDRLTYNDETIPNTIRAQNVSGTTPLTNLGATTINSAWVFSALGDNQNSRTSTGGDIGSPGNYVGGSGSVTPPVTPPAPSLPTVNLSVSSNTGSEANTSKITVTATASAALTTAQTVSVGVTGTDITAGDFYLTNSTIAIPSGQTTGSVTFIVADDAIAEGAETAVLTIATPSAGIALGTTVSQNIAIANNANSFLTRVGNITSTNGAEIPAFDPASDRLFTVAGNTIEIFNVSNTGALALAGTLPAGFTAPTGSEIIPNSVAVNNGIVAVAYAVVVTATRAQQNGRVSFYNAASGTFVNSVEVGFLPDQITFTPDGTKVLTANEGEPNSYNQPNSFDPEGSVSIINIANGVAAATVQTASFTSFNSQIDALRADGVRIFGPNATVAQDLEPEYIAVDPNGRTAQVVLQENNAIAILDIDNARIIDILPLGLKNFNQPTVTGLETYEFTNLPSLGNTAAGQSIPLGGFSGLTYDGVAANGNLKFITNTDRGPNGEPTGINRPFYLPNFTPEIIRFELNQTTGNLAITQRIQLKDSLGNNLSGRPNTAISTNANQAFNDEVPVDLRGNVLPRDPLGADLEGIVVDPSNGSFWLVDEYRPAIYNFNSTGVLIERFVPIGTAAAAGQPVGTFGTEVLPTVLGQRRQNRGFEAVALQDGKLLAFVQSPIRNPASLSNATLNSSQNIRIVEFDPITKATRQFIYILDNPPAANADDTIADKVGDAVAIGNGEFLIVERDDDSIANDAIGDIQKKVYRFSLGNATDISSLPALINGKSVDQLTTAELAAAGVNPIRKSLYVDLTEAGYNTVEKVEGLTIIDRNTIAVINDNDFTVAAIPIDQATGTFIPAAEPTPIVLGIISLQNNGLDASDRDLTASTGRINIQSYPVFGAYQPDAIASFTANGQTYYISANEGDARDYPGSNETAFNEEVRVGASSYTLDPAIFPNAASLKDVANLGRLIVTNATGNTDADPEFEQIVTFGARSFSIRDSANNLVFDSGDQLERITADLAPTLFNSEGTATGFDTRSDNKGPEPEGVVVGVINNRTYAFIGLERVGDVIVYEITDPTQPVFIQYINTPEDRATEGLAFVSANDSPTGKPLLITASEASNTVSTFEVNAPTRISDIQGARQRSPLEGQAVTTRGIVTALATNGFYLQDPNPDSLDATSEGIFVFTSAAPNATLVRVGASLQVSGTVSEFRPGNNPENLTTTQIGGTTANPLGITAIASLGIITPTIIGAGGRTIPTQSIQPTPIIQTLENISASALLSEIQQPNLTPNTDATGNFTYRFNGNQVTVSGSYSGLTSALTSINLNLGAARTFGTLLGDLTVTGTTVINTVVNTNFTGTFTLNAAQLTEFQAGRAYVNVSSVNFPVGELRGQLGPSIELSAVFDPTTSGLDFFESLEGTLVQINNPVAISPTNNFGEIFLLADNGDGATGRTARGGIVVSPGDFNPERIQIDDDLASIATNPDINVGGTLSTIQGVVSYNFNNFEVQVTALPTVLSNPLTREVTPLVGTANQLTIGAFNVENLDPSDTLFGALSNQIVNNLRSPDILSVEEIQDNNGVTNNGVVDATTTYNLLIAAIAAAGGPTYQFRQIDPVNNQDGGQPGGNIRVGFLFNPSRVTFVDRPGATSTNQTSVVNNNGNLETTLSPGRLQDNNLADGDAFNSSRKPLVGEFIFNGQQVIVVGNHLNSKGGDQPLSGPTQAPQVFSETQRLQQAQIINNFVDSALAINPNANIVVLGDINDFEFSEPTNVLRGVPNGVGTPVLTSLLSTIPANERYTFNFQGNAQVLDQILVSNNLASRLDGFDVLNINSEFFDQVSDHDPSVARFNLPANNAPVVANAIADQTSTEDSAFSFTFAANAFTDSDAGDSIRFAATLENGNALPSWLTFNATTRTFSGTPDNGDVGILNVRVTATDNARASVSDVFTLTVANTNDAPVLANAIADQVAAEDTAFSFTFASNSFSDIDESDSLNFTATLENGNALPVWLSFNATTRTFNGTPANADVGSVNIRVVATDIGGSTISDVFALTVNNTNDAPTVTNFIADQSATQGRAFSFQVPVNTFTDADAGDVLTFSATRADGTALPAWLAFNATTLTFSGTPQEGDLGNLNVKVTASDRANSTVSDNFEIRTVSLINEVAGIITTTSGNDLLVAAPSSPFNGQGNIVFTGAGNDTVDLLPVPSSGRNRIYLGSNQDIIFANGGDRLFGGSEDDIFEATEGTGNNRMYGGVGNDTFFLGTKDFAFGGEGNDRIFAGVGGDNTFVGGGGNDQFWIVNAELPASSSTILDFTIGQDVIGLSGAASLGITPANLTINQLGANTAIGFNGQTLAILNGIQSSSLSAANPAQFVFA